MNRDELIRFKLPLVGRAVRWYLTRNPGLAYLRDDLRSAATIALLRGIDRLKPGIESPDAYLMRAMQNGIADAVNKEDTIRVPAESRRDAKRKGKPIDPVKCVALPDNVVDKRAGDPLTVLLECCINDNERKIVRLRAAGYQISEIEARVGLKYWRVSRIISAVAKRFRDGEPGSDDPFIKFDRQRGTATTCGCGQPVKFGNETRCDDCWAEDQNRFHGRSQRVNITKAHVA